MSTHFIAAIVTTETPLILKIAEWVLIGAIVVVTMMCACVQAKTTEILQSADRQRIRLHLQEQAPVPAEPVPAEHHHPTRAPKNRLRLALSVLTAS